MEKNILPFDKRTGWIWLDGQLVPWQEATVHVLTHTLHYGMGVFEGVRAYPTDRGPAIFRLADHTKRLFASAHIVGMDIPYDQDTINQAHKTVMQKNNLDSGYIRPLCFYGSEGMGLKAKQLTTHVMVAAWPWDAYLGKAAMDSGIAAKTSSYRRLASNSSLAKAKACGNYLNSVLASNEAVADGYDEALLLDEKGCVAEGPGENIFAYRNQTLLTPTLEYVLEGITRDSIITLAKKNNIAVVERSLTRDELYVSDEVFLTGTAAEVVPVREIDTRTIGNKTPGPITQQLQTLYHDIVSGKHNEYQSWLTYV